jgi:GLPGLI family protein
MKYTYLIATFIFYVNIYSQENNQLFVEYNFKNDYYQNKELLIVKNNKTLYTNDTLNIKGNTKVIKDEEGNYIINPTNINLKKKSIFGSLNDKKLNIILPYKNKMYFVSDSLYNLNWKIQPSDTLKIGKYNCTKAILNFRGRDYEAYFTEEIPISAGPWKFKSLPGLILFIKSTSGELTYSWQANKIIYPYNSNIKSEFSYKFKNKTIGLEEYIKLKEADFLKENQILDTRAPKGTNIEYSKVERLGIELIYEWEK